MQKIYNLDKWFELKEGDALSMKAARARTVRIDVNSPAEVALYIRVGDEVLFLALVKGRDTIEFSSPGGEEFALLCEGASCYVHSNDGQAVHNVAPDAVSFTKIIERKPRNHDYEVMQFEMRRNMTRMMEQQAGELERIVARRLAAERALTPPQGTPAGDRGEPAPAGDGAAPGAAAPAADGGGKAAKKPAAAAD